LQEACALLREHGGRAKLLAGGTDLLIDMRDRKLTPQYLIALRNIPGLNDIAYDEGAGLLRIGPLVTLQEVADSPLIRERFSILAAACGKAGPPPVRNVATIGGNVCNGGPSQDTTPPLLALGARLRVVREGGERVLPIEEFFLAPFRTALEEGEILAEIQIPAPPPRSAGGYQRLTKITADDEALVATAVLLTLGEEGLCRDVRIGLCSVAPTPMRARGAEEALKGRRLEEGAIEAAAKIAAQEVQPRSRAEYRRRMTAVLVRRALKEALAKLV